MIETPLKQTTTAEVKKNQEPHKIILLLLQILMK